MWNTTTRTRATARRQSRYRSRDTGAATTVTRGMMSAPLLDGVVGDALLDRLTGRLYAWYCS